jgi:hypothetical protein
MSTRGWLMDEWRDTFLTEARLRGMPGAQIGDVLAEIDTHCRDSGQSPEVAFGDPVRYAQTVSSRIATSASADRRRLWTNTAIAAAGLVGVMALLDGVEALSQRDRAAVSIGQLIAAGAGVVVVIATVAVVLRPGRWRRHFHWRIGAALALGMAAVIIPQSVWPQVAFHSPGWPVLCVGIALIALAWWPLFRTLPAADRVIDPRTGSEPYAIPRLPLLIVRFSLPAVLLIVVLLVVFVLAR